MTTLFTRKNRKTWQTILASLAAAVGIASVVYAAAPFESISAHNPRPRKIDAYGLCKNITNNNDNDIFVPLNTQSEWRSFVDKAPNVTLAGCVVDVPGCTDTSAANYNPSATSNNGSCVYNPTYFYCGYSGQWGNVYLTNLWKQVGDVRYYLGSTDPANGADTFSCIGTWNEKTAQWTSSKFCKYGDERECMGAAGVGGSVYSSTYPSCGYGRQPDGDGCRNGCDVPPNTLDSGYCIPIEYVAPPGGTGVGGKEKLN